MAHFKEPFDKPERQEVIISQFSGRKTIRPVEISPDSLEGLAKEELSVENVSLASRVSPWLLSIVVHILLMVLLALIIISRSHPEIEVAIFSDTLGDQLDIVTNDEGNLNPNVAEKYTLTVPSDLRVDDILVYEEKEYEFVSDMAASFYDQSRIEMSEMLSGRTDPGTKNDLLAKYGGNRVTQEAVEKGLLWLKKQQNKKDGSWSLKGPYQDGLFEGGTDNQVAATGLALLAFQGNGNTRFQGEYKAEVKKGVSWLLRQQQEDGCFIPSQVSTGSHFYTHAICTICLGELVVMEKSKGEDLRPVVRKAVDYLLKYQSPKGGWRYIPGDGESDLSVTGWCLMALQTAKMAGIRVPDEALQKISDFVDSVSYNDGSEYAYRYTDGGLTNKRISMTATGLLCREYLGWEQDNPALLRGAELVTKPENLIRFPDPAAKESGGTFSQNVYGWYSASMMLKHLGPYNKYWRSWNKVMSQELPAHQEPDQSQEAGSWNPDYDEYRKSGGRLYVTCLSIFCLEVYYRHLSLYR